MSETINVDVTIPANRVEASVSGQDRNIGAEVTGQSENTNVRISGHDVSFTTSVEVRQKQISSAVDKRPCPHTPYEGGYTFTPGATTQIIPTRRKVMDEDIIINPVPSWYGLITYNGRIITVS